MTAGAATARGRGCDWNASEMTASQEHRAGTRSAGLPKGTGCSAEEEPTSCWEVPGATPSTPDLAATSFAISYDGLRDAVRCGPGADVVNADLTDSVAGDCELVGRRPRATRTRQRTRKHETEVEPDSFTFGRTTVATFQVGRRFDGAATNVGYAVTRNGGTTGAAGFSPA